MLRRILAVKCIHLLSQRIFRNDLQEGFYGLERKKRDKHQREYLTLIAGVMVAAY